MGNKKQKDEAGLWEAAIQKQAKEKGISFERAAMENIKYHKSLADQGVFGGKESYRFFENLLLRIMGKRSGGNEKKG